ncbi:PBS lyase [Agromyces intestinalis]|uniref:PBS lyase n=2 Tax=Agromyces intestinalis TaxID=2592652 RepID=A0A5C1YM26_9MICO|nr:PBS lyase [Agromyces intestinalis]
MLSATGIDPFAGPPASRFHDPAEHLDFARPLTDRFLPYDTRSDRQLLAAAREDDSPLERERALWEFADRTGPDALGLVDEIIREETSRDVRQGALWLALKLAGTASAETLANYTDDVDPEVADWARVLLGDVSGEAVSRVYTTALVEETGYFDQTVPLVISGNIIVQLPGVGAARAVLSPLWFDSILGRVLACTNTDTIRTDLTVEKELDAFHEDGSAHYEIFPFRGHSVEYEGKLLEHNYMSDTIRPYYPSGLVEVGEAIDSPVSLLRIALTHLADQDEYEIIGDGPRADRVRAAEFPFVKSVRGRFYGFAATNLEAAMEAGIVQAGHVQLANPSDPVAGPATNTKMYGTFRGKAGDYTSADAFTLNAIKCHGRPDGSIDTVTGGAELGR